MIFKYRQAKGLLAVTNHPKNSKYYDTNRSKTRKIHSAGITLMQQIEVGHGQKPVFIFETFGKIRRAGKPALKCDL